MKKSTRQILIFAFVGLVVGFIFIYIRTTNIDDEDLRAASIAKNYIQYHFSDGAPGTEFDDSIFSQDTEALRTYVDYRDKVRERYGFKDLEYTSFEVKNAHLNKDFKGPVNVIFQTLETYNKPPGPDGETEFVNAYRVHLKKENKDWRIDEVVAIDPSGRILMPEMEHLSFKEIADYDMGEGAYKKAISRIDIDAILAQAPTN